MAMLPMTDPGEVLRLTTLFEDPYWATYRCSAPQEDCMALTRTVYVKLSGAYNPLDERLLHKARRVFLGNHPKTTCQPHDIKCQLVDCSKSIEAKFPDLRF